MDTKKLRQKILDLAIRGKLVSQEGKWKTLKIKDVFIINPKNKEADDKLAGFVPMSNIQDGYRDCFVCEAKLWGTIKKGFTHFADGDIAIAKISPCLENRKSMILANLPNGIGAGTTELIVFRCKEDIIPKYGLYFFKTQFFIDSCVGTFNGVVGQQRVGKNIVEEIAIPLPPLAEQKRIVTAIEQWFDLIDILENEKNDLQAFILQAKSKILDLAIHGKLVPQDSNDEPAIELLKRINPKFEPYDEEDCPHEVPESWTFCYLQNVFKITMGSSPVGESLNRIGEGIEFHQGKMCFSELYIGISDVYSTEPIKIADPDSLLLCVRAPVGIVNICNREICIGRGLCALTPLQGLDLKYGFYALQTCQQDFEQKATGSTFKAISGDVVKKQIIPLPPYQEQLRIVAKIEELFAVLDNIKESLA